MSIAIAIHQPNYLPWMGFIAKMYLSDIFIIHDNVEYSKSGFTKRTNIRKTAPTPQKQYLSIPLQKQSDFTLIKELRIDHQKDWSKKHLEKIKHSYSKAPFFDTFFPTIKELLNQAKQYETLSTYNSFLIQAIAKLLNLSCELVYSSQLPVSGIRSEYNLNLIKHFSGNRYISGMGAKNYQDKKDFEVANIQLVYADVYSYLQTHPYPQQQGNFINGLSILDPLFNIGIDDTLQILKDFKQTLPLS